MNRVGWLVGVAAGLLLVAQPPAALASANASWATGVEAAPPANANSTPTVSISSVSCASAGYCSAVGTYYDSSNHTQGLLLTKISGTWATGVEASPPANANASPFIYLRSVSCSSAGNCSAIGQYTDSSNNTQGMLLTETSGTWATGVEASPPANAGTSPAVSISSISCVSAGNCSAVGQYTDSSNNTQGLVLTETSGTWATGVEASLPANAGTSPAVSISSISCVSAGNCSAVGTYYDNSNVRQGLFLTQAGGTWGSGAEAQLPGNAKSNPQAAVVSVSCSSPGDCGAAGSYVDASNTIQALTFDQSSGTWMAGQELSLPAGAAASPSAGLNSISCTSAENCSAVGFYTDSSGHGQGLLANETSSTWSSGSAPLPANASSTNTGAVTNAVSCSSPGDCAAVGKYQDSSNHQQGLLLTETSGTWATGVEATPPAGASANPGLYPDSVSCGSAGSCSAVGYDYDTSNHQQGFMIDATPAAAALSISAPALDGAGQPISSSSVSAMLSGGSAPIGTITFEVFGPQASAPTSCSLGGAAVGTASVSGNGTYNPSAGFTPSSPGDYWWHAIYGGDASDSPAASTCGSAMAETVVTSPPPTISPPIVTSPPPTNSAPPSISGPAEQGQALTDSHGQWSNTPTSYSYQWEDCDSAGNTCTAISDATEQSYTLSGFDVGHTIRVVEIASNAAGSAQAVSSSTGIVAPLSLTNLSISTLAAVTRSSSTMDPGIRLSCPSGGSSCSANETATVLVEAADTPTGSGKHVPHAQTVGSAHFTIPAGGSVEALLRLNRLGRALLADHMRLPMQVKVSGEAEGATPVTATKTIELTGHRATYAVSAIRTQQDGTITLRVKVSAPGRVNILVTAWKDNVATVARLLPPAPRRFVLARATAPTNHATVLTFHVRPNAMGRLMIAHPAHRITLRLWVSYIPLGASQTNTGYYGLHPGSGCAHCRTRIKP